MPYHILSSNINDDHNNGHGLPTGNPSNLCTSPSSSYYYYQQNNSTSSEIDVSKHLKSLQARLGFARFKMNQGWEKSTLLDVEHLWKQKQQQCIKELPKPRFTQRDVIDKRIYIPSPGARQAKAKKAKLVRTYSNPSKWPSEPKENHPNYTKKNTNPLCFHHYNQQAPIHRLSISDDDLTDNEHRQHGSPSTVTMSSCIEEDDDDDDNDNDEYDEVTANGRPLHVRNSLDFLSYAIAMTEKAESANISSQPLPDISEMEPNLMDVKYEEGDHSDVEHLDIADKSQDSPPSSPVTSAAKAIMMFVNSQTPSTANNKYSQ